MPNFPGSEQWMIGSGYELLVISSIGGPNLNELSAPIHNSRPDPMPPLLDQPQFPRPIGGGTAVPHTKFLKYVADMGFHGRDVYGQFTGYFLVVEPFGQQLQYIKLAVCQGLGQWLWSRLPGLLMP